MFLWLRALHEEMSDGPDAGYAVLRGYRIEHACAHVRSLGRSRGIAAVPPEGRRVQEYCRPRARSAENVGIGCASCDVSAKGVAVMKARVESF